MADLFGLRRGRTVRGVAPTGAPYLAKALASLSCAQLELDRGYHDSAVNRAYYACYQAAVAALVAEDVAPVVERYWPHDVVQVKFPSVLVDQLHRYPNGMRGTLKAIFDERLKADYEPDAVSETTAREAVRRAQSFVGLVSARVGSQ
ncbi:MAG TPA: HEPN domain-containing protein [Chloroflexota bacterium]|nr:HEPN domain-containing protein [Chloroflexota bacterium]